MMKKYTLWITLSLSLCSSQFIFAQDVTTQHNDLNRTGWNNAETILKQSNVNTTNFGLLFTHQLDADAYGQPLVVSNVDINNTGNLKRVVYVTTVNNTLYALDADNGFEYWHVNYNSNPIATGRPPADFDMHPSLCGGGYFDFRGFFGIVGTPVVDPSSNTIYFVTKIANDAEGIDQGPHSGLLAEYAYTTTGFHQYLRAVDIRTGNDAQAAIEIKAQSPGTGDGASVGIINFDPRRQFDRAGLVLSNGIVYVAFAAHCDFNPCHGWVLGYRANNIHSNAPFPQLTYNATPNDGRGGIWMSGGAPPVDASGRLYLATGNGLNDDPYQAGVNDNNLHNNYNVDPLDPANRGESVFRITPNSLSNTANAFVTLTTADFFTPFDHKYLNDKDADFPVQTMLVPGTNLLVTACKNDTLYVMNTASGLGSFNATSNNVVQQIDVGGGGRAFQHASLAYFGGATNQYLYQFSENTQLQAWAVLGGGTSLGNKLTSSITGPGGTAGAVMSTSSNGTDNTTGILWVYMPVPGCDAGGGNYCPGMLRALKADNIGSPSAEIWNSTQNSLDNVLEYTKMSCPTISNGKVYLNSTNDRSGSGTSNLAVYGLLTSSRCINNVSDHKNATATSGTGGAPCCAPGLANDGDVTTRWSSNGDPLGNNAYLTIDLGANYDICKVLITWETAYGKDFKLQVAMQGVDTSKAANWTTFDSETNFAGGNNVTFEFDGAATGRYVRMQGVTAGTGFGYSIWDMQVFGTLAALCATPSSLTATNVTENTATLNWSAVSGATSYIVKYGPTIVSSQITRTITTPSPPSNSLNISALSCNGYTYNYSVQAVCGVNNSAVSPQSGFSTDNCSVSCVGVGNRFASADIGDIGMAGRTCMNGTNYVLTGSGAGIGGVDDQFQFAWENDGNTNEEVSGQILSPAPSQGLIGLMIRDSITNTSRYAFVGINVATNKFVFMYRSSPSGPVTTINGPTAVFNSFVKIDKLGTNFQAFYSPDGGTTWVQIGTVGSQVNLNFGISHGIAYGMAMTSTSNGVLATGSVGSFTIGPPNPLPIKLTSFTATNVNNDHVAISWSTSTEQNVDHYEIERSQDGSYFQMISSVKAVGNSETTVNYSTQDNNPLQGVNLYRLKEIDEDGKFWYSWVVPVQVGSAVGPVIYPNPATTTTTVVSGAELVVEVTIFDVSGKELSHIMNTSGSPNITINTGGLSTGIYIIKMKTNTKTYQQKLLKH